MLECLCQLTLQVEFVMCSFDSVFGLFDLETLLRLSNLDFVCSLCLPDRRPDRPNLLPNQSFKVNKNVIVFLEVCLWVRVPMACLKIGSPQNGCVADWLKQCRQCEDPFELSSKQGSSAMSQFRNDPCVHVQKQCCWASLRLMTTRDASRLVAVTGSMGSGACPVPRGNL